MFEVDVLAVDPEFEAVVANFLKNGLRPATICRTSSSGTIPCRASIRQCAIEPRMSCRYSRRSTPIEAPNASAISLGAFEKRPPRAPRPEYRR